MIFACVSGALGENNLAEVAVIKQAATSEVAKVVRAFMIVESVGRDGDGDQGGSCLAALHMSAPLGIFVRQQARDPTVFLSFHHN